MKRLSRDDLEALADGKREDIEIDAEEGIAVVTIDGETYYATLSAVEILTFTYDGRRVLVLDPGDAAQIDRLMATWRLHGGGDYKGFTADAAKRQASAMAAALNHLTRPKPTV